MSDIAALGFEIDSAPVLNAIKDLRALDAAAGKTEAQTQRLSRAFAGIEKSKFLKGAATGVAEYGREVDGLQSSFSSLIGAQAKFDADIARINAALSKGVLTMDQANYAARQLGAANLEAARGMNVYAGGLPAFGKNMQVSTHHATNLSYQLNDIGMMMASGQSPFMLMLQQGPQVSQIFNAMTNEGKKIGPTLASAFTSILNPTTLLTMGVIAGGAALVQWGMSAMGAAANAQTFHDAVDGLDANVSELNESVGLLAVDNYDKMLEKYGMLNQAVYDNIANIAGLNAQLISIAQIDLGGLFSEEFGGYLTNRIDEMRIAFDTTNDQARVLLAMMEEVGNARGPDQLIQSLTAMRNELIDTAGGIKNLTIKQAEFVLEIERAIQKATIAKGKLHELEAAAPDGTWMNPAIGGVDALIGRVNAALGRVSALSAASSEAAQRQFDRDNKVYSGRGGDPRQFMGNGPSVFVPNEDVGTGGGSGGGGGGGGAGGGGGGGGADPYADNLTRLIESMQTERETVDAWYNENLSILNDRRAMEILGEQGHKDALLALEQDYQEKLASQRSQRLSETAGFFGELANIASVGGQKSAKAVATFQAIEGTVNAYGAAIKALNTPGISLPGRFAAYASVLGAGLKGVAAIKSAGGGSSRPSVASSAGTATAPTSATTATRAEPERVTRVELQGEDWLVSLAESMMSQIYDASKNGRVIVARA